MTEFTTLMFSILFCLVGVGLGFIFGWFSNEYYTSFMEATVGANMNIHPEMMNDQGLIICLLYTSPSPRDAHESRMPSSA